MLNAYCFLSSALVFFKKIQTSKCSPTCSQSFKLHEHLRSASSEGRTPLCHAAMRNRLAPLKLLLKATANVEAADKNGREPSTGGGLLSIPSESDATVRGVDWQPMPFGCGSIRVGVHGSQCDTSANFHLKHLFKQGNLHPQESFDFKNHLILPTLSAPLTPPKA